MIRLCESEEGVDRLCASVRQGRIAPSALARSLLMVKSRRWSERMDTLLEVINILLVFLIAIQ